MSLWSLPSWFSALVLAGLALLLWVRRPPAPLWPALFLCNVLALAWVVGDLGTYFTTEVWQEEIAVSVLYTGSIGTAVAWWMTAVTYVRSHGLAYRWIGSGWTRLPILFGVATWLLMITNHWHGEFVTPVVGARNVMQWGVAVTASVTYPLVACASLLFFVLSRRHHSRDVRANARILALATLAPLIISLLYAYGPWQVPLDFAAIGLGIGGVAIAHGIYRNRLFGLLPVALTEILRHDSTGILVVDLEGRLLFWNPSVQRLIPGFPVGYGLDLFAALADRLRHPGDEKPVGDEVGLANQLTRSPQPEAGHLFQLFRLFQPGNAEERWLRVWGAAIPSRRGEIVAHSLRVTDVTAQRQAESQRRALEAQIQHVEKLKSLGVLAGGIAHDFNNLLTVILGNASLALEDLPSDTPVHEFVGEIEEVTQNAVGLTEQLLAYSGRAQLSTEAVDLSALIEDMARLIQLSISKKVTLERHLDVALPAIEADPSQLRQVVLNLVTNASEAMGVHAGHVAIRTGTVDEVRRPAQADPYGQKIATGPYVVLEVSDDGCGMEEDARRRIFDPFFTTKFKGRGLGMAAAFGVVRGHGGAIFVESVPGKGSTVRVLFPVAPPDTIARSPDHRPARPMPEDWRSSGVILVVDDEPAVRRVASSILQRAGFKILSARDGEEAVLQLREHADAIRLVLLDLTMPGAGGEETLHELRRIDPGVRVLLSSGYDEKDSMRRLQPLPSTTAFVHKPYRAADLIDSVRRVLED